MGSRGHLKGTFIYCFFFVTFGRMGCESCGHFLDFPFNCVSLFLRFKIIFRGLRGKSDVTMGGTDRNFRGRVRANIFLS